MRRFPIIAATLLTLTACNRSAPDEESSQAAPAESLPSSSAAPAQSADLSHPQHGIPQQGIPVSMRGRWGLVSADCEKGRSDAKGLMIVSPTTITFYESVGQLSSISSSSDSKFDARFSFMGEGMNWERQVSFQLSKNGDTLFRTDADGPDTTNGQFTYKRCSN